MDSARIVSSALLSAKAENADLKRQLEKAHENETRLLAAVIRNGRPRLSEEDPCTSS